MVSLDDYDIPTHEGIEHLSAWNVEDLLCGLPFYAHEKLLSGLPSGRDRKAPESVLHEPLWLIPPLFGL